MNIDWKNIKLPSSYLPEKIGDPLRFMLVGTLGSFVQTGFFLLAMTYLGEPAKETFMYYVAFTIGFVCEMIPNYFITNWYTFKTKPSWENAGGFVLARAANLVLQLVCLPLMVAWLPQFSNGVISFVVIFVAGIVNFLIQLLFFKKPKTK